MDAYANVSVMPAYRADKANVFANAVGVQIEQRTPQAGQGIAARVGQCLDFLMRFLFIVS